MTPLFSGDTVYRAPTAPTLPPQSDLRDRLDQLLGGHYRIERELGGGGMSRVFLAEEVALGRRVVVKVLEPELAQGLSADRFARAAKLAARPQDPRIVPVLTAAITDNTVDGALYATYLREQGRLGALAGDRETAIAAYRRYLRLRARHEPALERDYANGEIGARKAGAAERRTVTASI